MKFNRVFTLFEGNTILSVEDDNFIVNGVKIPIKDKYTKPETGYNTLLPLVKRYGMKSEKLSKIGNPDAQDTHKKTTALFKGSEVLTNGISLGGKKDIILLWDRMKTIYSVIQGDNESKDDMWERAKDVDKNVQGKPIAPKAEKTPRKVDFYSDPHATGTTHKYQSNGFSKQVVHTDGVAVMVEKLQAHWLLDVIVSHIPTINKYNPQETFLTALLVKNATGSGCKFTFDDGNGKILVTQRIQFTDIEQNVKLFVVKDDKYWTIMLPSEY